MGHGREICASGAPNDFSRSSETPNAPIHYPEEPEFVTHITRTRAELFKSGLFYAILHRRAYHYKQGLYLKSEITFHKKKLTPADRASRITRFFLNANYR